MNPSTRFAQEEDFDDIFELLRQLWPDMKLNYNRLLSVYRKGLKADYQRYLVAVLDQKIAGFGSLTLKNNLWQAGNLGHIDELVVDEAFRGKGLGKLLISALTSLAKDLGCSRIELDSGFHRKEAHQFYENLGFENRAFLFSKKLN